MLNYADKTKNNNKKINTVNRNFGWKSNLNQPQTAWSWSSAVFLEKIKLNQERGGTALLRNISAARPTTSTVQQKLQNISIHIMKAIAFKALNDDFKDLEC